MQQWNDESTRCQLATDVVHIFAVRAWKSSDEPLLDQGLMVAYTKTDGSVHYRALAELTLREQLPLKKYIGISIDAVITTMPEIVDAEVSGNTILITTDIDISPRQEVRLTFYDAASLRYVQDDTSYLPVDTFTVIFEPDAGWDDHPVLNTAISLTTFDYFQPLS